MTYKTVSTGPFTAVVVDEDNGGEVVFEGTYNECQDWIDRG